MGSGGMIVMDDTASMVDVARYFLEFCKDESCGKCVPCRVGTWQMWQLLEQIVRGQATPRELALLRELCDVVQHTSLCGLGQTAPNPVLSTLRYFEHEYQDLVAAGAVPAAAARGAESTAAPGTGNQQETPS
jgi:bidirectional [NiFe] hydrogenase diaphorase subunit